ncbi:MAG: RNA methyltransferase [Phycisphaerales bacterium]
MTAGPVLHHVVPGDPRLAPYGGVRDADLRGRDGLYCAETLRVVMRFLRAAERRRRSSAPPALTPHSVLCCPRALDILQPALAAHPGLPVFVAPDGDTVTAISGYRLHSGALALGVRTAEDRHADLAAWAAPRPSALLVACDGVTQTDNVGAIFRNAASLGASGVLLSPNASDPFLRKTARVAMGRVFDVPWARTPGLPPVLRALQQHGFRVLAAEDLPAAVDVRTVTPAPRTVLVLGAEARGVSPEVLALADSVVRIPMSDLDGALATDPPTLNVAVASAVLLHALRMP